MKPSLLSVDEALDALLSRADVRSGIEEVPTSAALGRVLALDLRSDLNVPSVDNSQMDGYAVRVADLDAALDAALPVSQRIPAGAAGTTPLAAGTVARIFTGAPVPPGADAIVMQEDTQPEGDAVRVRTRPAPGQWIRRIGEDIREGSVILSAGTRLTPQALGLAASVGRAQLTVRRPLRVACFFTGDELVMPGEPLPPGAIYNSNRFVIAALLQDLGCQVTDLGIIPDSLEATRAALRQAASGHDLIVSCGGMSVGEEDHVKPAVQAEGELLTWQIAIKPGKPLAWGRVGTPEAGAHFIGLPGNPVSSYVTFLVFVRAFLLKLQGVEAVHPPRLPLRADFDWPRPDRRREFLRVRINAQGGLDLFPNQGSAVLTSTVWADGLVDNPAGQAIARGDTVSFLSLAALR